MLRHFEGLFELILRLMPLFDASETLLDVARAANICVFRGTAPLGAYHRDFPKIRIDAVRRRDVPFGLTSEVDSPTRPQVPIRRKPYDGGFQYG